MEFLNHSFFIKEMLYFLMDYPWVLDYFLILIRQDTFFHEMFFFKIDCNKHIFIKYLLAQCQAQDLLLRLHQTVG